MWRRFAPVSVVMFPAAVPSSQRAGTGPVGALITAFAVDLESGTSTGNLLFTRRGVEQLGSSLGS